MVPRSINPQAHLRQILRPHDPQPGLRLFDPSGCGRQIGTVGQGISDQRVERPVAEKLPPPLAEAGGVLQEPRRMEVAAGGLHLGRIETRGARREDRQHGGRCQEQAFHGCTFVF